MYWNFLKKVAKKYLNEILMQLVFTFFIINFFTFQRFLLSITPEKEQQDIIDGKPGKRANLNHWISL